MKTFWSVLFAGLGLIGPAAWAQEPAQSGQGIVISAAKTVGADGEGNMEIMSFSTEGGDAMMFSAPLDSAMSGGFMPGMMDSFGMLNNEGVQNELEFVGEQRDKYKRLQSEYNSRLKSKLDEMNKGGFDPERARELGDEIRAMKEQQSKDIEDLLLPHQISRMKQIQLQQRMRAMGAANALSDQKIAEELGLSEEQIAKLKERAKELAEELQKKVQKLREETQNTLLKELDPDQREKLNALIGEKFEVQPSTPFPGRMRNRTERRERPNDGDE